MLRSYSMNPDYEAAARTIEDSLSAGSTKEVILPGANLLFDGSELRPYEIGACLQARQTRFLDSRGFYCLCFSSSQTESSELNAALPHNYLLEFLVIPDVASSCLRVIHIVL